MSSKKEKFLESAQKFIVKGQLDRAIKDYEQVVALDPNDIRHRQRLAELLVRANRTLEAISEYEAIGKHYADNGFYLKAIAVYKQVQKLDPDNIRTSLSLADLNEKQGLSGNALAEYGRVYSHYEKSGMMKDALQVLESMITIDPENLTTRLKIAETRYVLGQKDAAYEEFSQIAIQLRRRGDEGACGQIADRVRYLFPDKKSFVLELLSSEIESGNAPLAVRHLQELTEKDQTNLKAWRLLLEAYQKTGALAEIGAALQAMVRIFPDDPGARERLMQSALDDGDVDGGLELIDQYGAFFEARGELHVLERVYQGLLAAAPHDSRLLKGLMKLYEASGQREKLAEMVERPDSQTLEQPRPDAAPAAPPPETVAAVGTDATVEGQADNLEEIPLSLADEEDAGPLWGEVGILPGHVAAGPAEAGDEAVIVAGVADDLDFPLEVDLELELSEDELADMVAPYGDNAEYAGTDHGAGDADAGGPAAEELSAGQPVDTFFEPEAVPEDEGGSWSGQETSGPAEIFTGFKKGLDQQLDQGDTETRYNLGIAFKEMGLYDEAMAEFEAAASDPQRRIDCLTLQGICCRDKGDFARAEQIFRVGIAQEGLSGEEFLSITYELALLYESAGRAEDALAAYRQIQARQPDFRETEEKIARLQGGEVMDELELVELEQEDLV